MGTVLRGRVEFWSPGHDGLRGRAEVDPVHLHQEGFPG